MNVMAIVKTKIGLSLAYAYDFRGAANDVEVQRNGNEIFLKFNFQTIVKLKICHGLPQDGRIMPRVVGAVYQMNSLKRLWKLLSSKFLHLKNNSSGLKVLTPL